MKTMPNLKRRALAKAAGALLIMMAVCAAAGPVFADTLLFADDFNRPDGDVIGNGSSTQAALADIADFSETENGVYIYWHKARFWDLNILGSADMYIPFGLAHPSGYSPVASLKYPLVLYLHGAGARGDDNQALQRSTARFFAASARTDPDKWNAFVLTPQCASNSRWVEWDWSKGPYNQTNTPGATYGEYLHLVENLLYFLVDSANNGALGDILGLDAADIDLSRIYVVGDSMGAYGTWDIVARQPGLFAGAIASAGSGPKNKLAQLRETPFWAIHGENDGTVPNALPSPGDPDGAGSLGMLGLLDPGFGGATSTAVVYVDDPNITNDDPPGTWKHFIYTEFPGMGHNPPASDWTALPTPGVREWLFAQSLPASGPSPDMNFDGDVDGSDLAAFAAAYAAESAGADLNEDGFIDEQDLEEFAGAFGGESE